MKKNISYEITLDDAAVKAVTGFFKAYYHIEDVDDVIFHIYQDEQGNTNLILKATVEM